MGKSSGFSRRQTAFPVSSRRTPGGKKICAVAQNRSGTRRNASCNALRKPGSTSMSLFSSSVFLYCPSAMPAFTARAKESGPAEWTTRIAGCSRASQAAVPSVLPLSTTITSPTSPCDSWASRSGSMACSSSQPSRLGTTTVTPSSSASLPRSGTSLPCLRSLFATTPRSCAKRARTGISASPGCRKRRSHWCARPPLTGTILRSNQPGSAARGKASRSSPYSASRRAHSSTAALLMLP